MINVQPQILTEFCSALTLQASSTTVSQENVSGKLGF